MELRAAFIGMGNVARAFAALLHCRREMLAERYSLSLKTVAISTGRHGSVRSGSGIDLQEALTILAQGGQLNKLKGCMPVNDPLEISHSSDADLIFETTPLNPTTGEPAITFIRAALERGVSVVTANKGPVAFAYRELAALAGSTGACFRFEGTVMDGAPVFNLAEFCLPGASVSGFSGVLNSTTNLILTEMESGRSFADSLAEAQRMGIAEAAPAYDVDGWDATVKAVALANVLMNARVSPKDVEREGIGNLSGADMIEARKSRHTIRLVSRASKNATGVSVQVRPERVRESSLFGSLNGTDNALVIETDMMKEIAIVERNPEIEQTAYALLSDLITVHDALVRIRG